MTRIIIIFFLLGTSEVSGIARGRGQVRLLIEHMKNRIHVYMRGFAVGLWQGQKPEIVNDSDWFW